MSGDTTAAALEPLRAALLARARADADAVRAAAQRERADRLAAAGRDADGLLAAARRRGEEDAAALREAEHADARRAARAVVLRAQAAVHDDLRARAAAAVAALLADPLSRERLAAALQARLGDQTVVHDAPDGGLLATSPDGRGIDASAGALVAAALQDMDLEGLWTA